MKVSAWIGLSLLLSLLAGALFAPWIAPYSPLQDFAGLENLPPWSFVEQKFFLLGTDSMGRDLFSRIVFGTRYTLAMSIGAVSFAAAIGLPLGMLAGFYPGADRFLSKASDILMAFPSLLIAIMVVAILGPGFFNAVIAVGVTNIVPFFRLMRTQVRSESNKDYVMAAYALGSRDTRILLRHVLPNTWSPILVLASLSMGSACLESAALSFLNLGVSPPAPEWGSMIRSGMETFLSSNPWVSSFSGLAIFVSVLGFNLAGDALRDALDPRALARK